MINHPPGILFPLVASLAIGLSGCARPPLNVSAEPTVVTVSVPVERDVTNYADFTGRTAAVDSVELRARVWGYLDKVNFKEGATVQKGDLLFVIDPLTYAAALDQAEGNLASMQARLVRLDADLARAQRMFKTNAISREDLDKVAGDRGEAAASRAALQAAVERAKLDLRYTKVTAPISGRVSRYIVTVGNLVQAGDQGGGTLLTTIVSVDPMYAYFDVDEHTALRVRQLAREGKADSPRDGNYPVSLGLANEDGHPHQGAINFVDNQVNPKTGTIRVRGVFPNKEQVLLPGLFVRVRTPIGRPHTALLVSDRAFDTDQGQKIVYVVNDKNEVVSRPVQLGALHDGLREVTDGLKPGEQVIVNGLQQVRPGLTVETKLVDMPRINPKFETRNTKSEVPVPKSEAPNRKVNPKSESRNPKQSEAAKPIDACRTPSFGISDFEFRIFLLRLSCWRDSSSTDRSWRG
jgi:RND family efflux transporter MFP subunit